LTVRHNAIDADRSADVLKLLLAHILERDVELAVGVLLNPTGDADAPRLRKGLQARSHVHPIPENVARLGDYISLVDADPELDALVLRDVRIPLGHPTLDLHGTAERVHDTCELHEEAVSRGLHDPTTVLGDFWVHESSAVALEPGERAFLVGRHETTVTNDISGQDGCEPTLYALGC
jgi:hypothetical protein